MTALTWQATIAITILAAFFLSYLFLSWKRAMQIGLGVVLFWLAWTVGLSAIFVGYSLSGPLAEFQFFLILFVGAAAAAVVYTFNNWKRRNEKLLQKNQTLLGELNELEKNFGSPVPGSKLSPSKILHGTRDHRKELMRQLKSAEKRIVIMSGWVTEYGFDRGVKKALDQAARKNLKIFIGWGYRTKSDETSGNAQMNSAEEKLITLARKYPKCFVLAHFKNHAKLLLVDSVCIIGSFNWLSNAFSTNEEISAIVDDPQFVQDMYGSVVSSLQAHADRSAF
jgi:phosphatidylserine/phosphatidylglycerophosphate/cardiolipin synthase-like enzyme